MISNTTYVWGWSGWEFDMRRIEQTRKELAWLNSTREPLDLEAIFERMIRPLLLVFRRFDFRSSPRWSSKRWKSKT